MRYKDIFELIKTEKTAYETSQGVPVADGYEWLMSEHIRKCILYKDGKLLTGNSDDKPVKNIILPILNVAYRTEGFDVKDIEPYVDNAEEYYKSLLIRKFHDRWAREQGIDTFIDEVVTSYVDFGGVLVKNVKGARPEVIPLQKLAFCDQTDILSGPFAIKHQLSIDQLKEKSDVWDAEKIDDVITQARYEKTVDQSFGKSTDTPGKYIEVYEVHGVFPNAWITGDSRDYVSEDESNFVRQIQIVALYNDKESKRHGVTLFKGPIKQLFKVLKRDARFGTALGRSAIEELIEDQVWTNYNMIQIKNMLDKAGMMLGVTDDTTFASKNKFTDLDQGEWLVNQPGTSVQPFVFPTSNLQQFENSVIMWEQHARTIGSASDPQLGLNPTSGTPLGTTQIVTNQGEGIHEYRRGQIAAFIEEIYRDWIIPHLTSKINKGQEFLSELSLDELQEVSEAVVTNHVNEIVKKHILNGGVIPQEAIDSLKISTREIFMKDGNKRFFEIFKDEFKDTPIDVMVNVAGKQKNLAAYVDKLSNIIRVVLANPAILQDPNAAKILNTMFEASGISPMIFKSQTVQQQGQQMGVPVQSPVQPSLQNKQPIV